MKAKLGLSRRRKVPVLYLFRHTFLLHEGLQLMMRFRWLKTISEATKTVTLAAYGQRLKLLNEYAMWLIAEWDIWKKYYLPRFSLNGKTILDVGAGCGETAFFYFLHGAKKIIAIEPYVMAVQCLKENARVNRWNIKIIPEEFKTEHLKIPHDFMKMDIEGQEKELLKLPEITKPCVVEVHSNDLKRKFENKGFQKVHTLSESVHLMTLKHKSDVSTHSPYKSMQTRGN